MAESAVARKARGAFFTPPAIASFLANWAVRSADARVFEPSCGEAVFLHAAADRLAQLGTTPSDGQLAGIDLHSGSVAAATSTLAARDVDVALQVGDFFAYNPEPVWDAVVGNPPFIRYQDFAGSQRARARMAALEAGVSLSALASSWAAFVVHASKLLTDDGRLGLVLPAELLTTNYAAPVRSWLLNRFANVRVVMFSERVFPEVQEEVVLLLADGSGTTDHLKVYETCNAETLQAAEELSWLTADPESDWIGALVDPSTLQTHQQLQSAGDFAPLGDWGAVNLGAVTGNNDWFTLSPAQAAELGLNEDETVRISPPGSRHLRGLTLSRHAWRQMGDDGAATLLFRPGPDPSASARIRIEAGEADDVHQAYKCRVRSPWWQVPLGARPDLFLTYMNADTPRLTHNHARVHALNSVHGVHLRDPLEQLGRSLLSIASVNSATQLGAELVGRAYGGGMLKVEPSEAARLPVPSPALITRHQQQLRSVRDRVARRLAARDLAEATRLVDEILLDPDDAHELRVARDKLALRRRRRGG